MSKVSVISKVKSICIACKQDFNLYLYYFKLLLIYFLVSTCLKLFYCIGLSIVGDNSPWWASVVCIEIWLEIKYLIWSYILSYKIMLRRYVVAWRAQGCSITSTSPSPILKNRCCKSFFSACQLVPSLSQHRHRF